RGEGDAVEEDAEPRRQAGDRRDRESPEREVRLEPVPLLALERNARQTLEGLRQHRRRITPDLRPGERVHAARRGRGREGARRGRWDDADLGETRRRLPLLRGGGEEGEEDGRQAAQDGGAHADADTSTSEWGRGARPSIWGGRRGGSGEL